MGCDIHAYIEIVNKADSRGKPYVDCFGGIRIGRDYNLFTLMAGVRGDQAQALFQPKGFPDPVIDMSWQVRDDYCLYVVDEEKDEQENSCSRKQAEKWVKSGSSEWVGEDKRLVTHPDWHTPSWLNIEELDMVQNEYVKLMAKYSYKEYFDLQNKMKDEPQWADMFERMISHFRITPHHKLAGVIGAMKGLRTDYCEPRLVFWFDN